MKSEFALEVEIEVDASPKAASYQFADKALRAPL